MLSVIKLNVIVVIIMLHIIILNDSLKYAIQKFSTECHSAKPNSVYRHSDVCRNAERLEGFGHSAESHSDECHSAECHFAECHSDVSNLVSFC